MDSLKQALGIAAVSIGLLAASFLGGWYVNGLRHDKKFAEFQTEMQTNLTAALERTASLENALQVHKNEFLFKAFEDEKSITATYDNLVSSKLFDSAASDRDVATTAPSAPADSKGQCDCLADYGKKFQRLYEQQLIVARDCDITASHYNALIDFYNGVRDEVGEVGERETGISKKRRQVSF